MAADGTLPWTSSMKHVFWLERCVVLSNHTKTVAVPNGSGFDYDQNESFHFSLLKERTWANDKFWYLAFLPRYPSFTRDPLLHIMGRSSETFPIVKDPEGLFLAPSFSNQWLELEKCLRETYNILKNRYLQLVPFQTQVPPWPSSTHFDGYYENAADVRNAAHRARRLFLAWTCIVSACIAASHSVAELDPPLWYRELCKVETKFPAYWLDNILKSRIFSMSTGIARRGLVINMAHQYGIIQSMTMFINCGIPVWLCFPHGCTYTWSLPKGIYPTEAQIEEARQKAIAGGMLVDTLVDMPLRGESSGEGVSAEFADTQAPESSGDATTSIHSLPYDHKTKTIARFIRPATESRISSIKDDFVLAHYRERVRSLHPSSTVYEWKLIEFHPWFARVLVPEEDKSAVWNSYHPASRFYSIEDDSWSCVSDFGLRGRAECVDPHCLDESHDHDDAVEGSSTLIRSRVPDQAHDVVVIQPSLHTASPHGEIAEFNSLSFSRARMDNFLDTLKYRYGLTLPTALSHQKHRLERYPQPVLKCIRAMVAEEDFNDVKWQDPRVLQMLGQFFSALCSESRVDPHISDCHLDHDVFIKAHDIWKISPFKIKLDDSSSFYMIPSTDSRVLGWIILVKTQSTMREIMRRRLGPSNIQIVDGMTRRGLEFSIICSSPLAETYIPQHLLTNVYREEGYKFSRWDYEEYMIVRLSLLNIPSVARAALRHGGILWRLCMESGVDSSVFGGFDVEGKGIRPNKCSINGLDIWEDTLPPELIDRLVGVYKVFTGK